MNKLLRKSFVNGKDVYDEVEMTFQDASLHLEALFWTDPDIAKIETTKFADGNYSISVKNDANKIIVQYKTQINGKETTTG